MQPAHIQSGVEALKWETSTETQEQEARTIGYTKIIYIYTHFEFVVEDLRHGRGDGGDPTELVFAKQSVKTGFTWLLRVSQDISPTG